MPGKSLAQKKWTMDEIEVERTSVIGESMRRASEKWDSLRNTAPPVKHTVLLDPTYRQIWIAVADEIEKATKDFRAKNDGAEPTLLQLLKARVNWNARQIVSILGRKPTQDEIKQITADIAEMIAHVIPRARVDGDAVLSRKERLEMQLEAIRRGIVPVEPAQGPAPVLADCQVPQDIPFVDQLKLINERYGNQEIDVELMASLFA